MIKKFKLGLFIAVFLLFGIAGTSYAATTYNADTTIDLSSPDINFTILSGSSSEDGLVVNAGTVVTTITSGQTFTLTSASRDLTITPAVVSGDTFTVNLTCTAGTAKVIIVGGNSTAFTITPASAQCSTASSGSGGGGSYVASTTPAVPALPAVPATPAIPGVVVPGCGNRTTGYSVSTGQSCAANTFTIPATPATPAVPSYSSVQSTYNFGTTILKNGSKGEAVRELQRFLNAKLYLGLAVDGKLGPKTIAVIKKWQKANGLVADGLVGPKTKMMMNFGSSNF